MSSPLRRRAGGNQCLSWRILYGDLLLVISCSISDPGHQVNKMGVPQRLELDGLPPSGPVFVVYFTLARLGNPPACFVQQRRLATLRGRTEQILCQNPLVWTRDRRSFATKATSRQSSLPSMKPEMVQKIDVASCLGMCHFRGWLGKIGT